MNLLAAITLSLAILTPGTRPYNHIFFVLLENVGYEAIVGDTVNAPYINNKLIPQGVLYTQSFGITHPSLPNYLQSFLATPKASPMTDATMGRLPPPTFGKK
jgi:phosphatidylinositol-3-phosphatase